MNSVTGSKIEPISPEEHCYKPRLVWKRLQITNP